MIPLSPGHSASRLSRLTHGQAALFITLSIPVTFGMLSLVVDIGWSYWRREACKTAAQAAATAAAMTVSQASNYICGNGVTCTTTETACPTSPTPPTDALMAGCLYAKQNGFTATGNQNVT